MAKSETYEVPQGGLWEYESWDLCTNCTHNGPETCPHGRNNVYPAVIVAYNEAGHNTTGVCLLCVIEAAREHGLLQEKLC